MDSQKLLALTSLLFIIKVYSAHAQCTGRVEFINQPCTPPSITARSYVQPVSQIVIPAIIQPLIQTESCMPALPPCIPDYSNLFNSLYASSAMPPIIFDNGSQNDLDNLLYFLLFAMRNKRNGGFGCGCGRGCCCGNSCGCSRCCGCFNSKGCGSCNCGGSCGNCGNNGDCGNGCNGCNGGCNGGYNGGCNCGCNGGCNGCNNGNGNCACGGNCMFIPYPIAIPIGNAFQSLNGGAYSIPVIEAVVGGCDDCPSSSIQTCNGQNQNEVTLVIKTDCQ